MRQVIASLLLLGGVAFTVVAGVGLLRFPDVFTRMHAATKPQTLGLLLAVLGAAVAVDDGSDRAKLLLVAVFGFLTAPVAAHMIGRAGYRAGSGNTDALVVDELRDADPRG
jgi:multicomponent Na+:H+ antiporter subunit G